MSGSSSGGSSPSQMNYNWLSFSIRYLVNVEDLNNVESAGNYIRHRRAPIVFKENGIYTVVYAPAVSGEMIAHGYQMNLAELASRKNLPVDSLAKQGILLKRGAGDDLHENSSCKDKNDQCGYEFCVIQDDIVEDVAGFLNPNKQIKRVSNVAFSYMIPALDAIKAVATNPQFHVRYTSKDLMKYQSLYNVETASASYILTGYLNIDGIGKTQNCKDNQKIENENDQNGKFIGSKPTREKVAIEALMLTLTQFLFGAKQTRFKPIVEIEAIIVSFSEKPFNLPPINGDFAEYLKQVTSSANAFADFLGISNVLINYYTKEKEEIRKEKDKVSLQAKENPVEVFKWTR